MGERVALEELEAEEAIARPALGRRRGAGASVWGRFLRNRLAVVGLVVLAVLVLTVAFGPLVIPAEKVTDQVRDATFAPPSGDAWFGRDEFGRDAFARAVYGGRLSLTISFVSALIATAIGVVLGGLAGYASGWVDAVIDRFIELILTLPFLLLLILAAAVAPTSPTSIVLILGLFGWPVLARLVRGEFIAIKHRDYVEAARACGASAPRVVVYHILPNAMAPIIVTATLILATNLIAEATISFLGLGIHPPTPSWGNMLTEAQTYLINSPFLAIFPGLLILVTVLCVNLLGDGLRDALDPRLKR
ncbi:MAG TPA: ABC transporter permease [Thermomicrobiales bacterium]|nr:ABC transporter permease [Thermomicrobiales bacterium]